MKRKKGNVPEDFEKVRPVLEKLEDELHMRMSESNEGKSKHESLWPVHQINHQKSRYIYNLFYRYHFIDRETYDYCIRNKLIDAALIAKWKKPGYEKLCSVLTIDPRNFPFGTTAICRVPLRDRAADQAEVKCSVTGCLGCYSGKTSLKNIFANKYGQNLARIQMLRERKKISDSGRIENLLETQKVVAKTWLEEDEELGGQDDSSTEEEDN